VIARVDAVKVPADDFGASILANNLLTGNLRTAASAALRLGRHAQAEALARRMLALPLDPTTEDDPRDRSSAARTLLAEAVARQGRTGEAQSILQPALDYYQREQQAGEAGSTFRGSYAYALYVSALASDSDPAKREAALNAASALVKGASPEVQALADMRQLSDLIAGLRGGKRA